MKVRPILMNGDMVRAVLEGRKTQTRRVVRLPDKDGSGDDRFVFRDSAAKTRFVDCPYGQTGDLLWVRERFRLYDINECACYEDCNCARYHGRPMYFADGFSEGDELKWKPSIHMPRWASRLTLEITDVRVERLQDISHEDAFSEGVTRQMRNSFGHAAEESEEAFNLRQAKSTFRLLWDSIYGTWDDNPWVWVLEFKAHRMNVDELMREAA